ncbi:hypothetical protein Trydic_g5658 [Trypoxylus dichotomus]
MESNKVLIRTDNNGSGERSGRCLELMALGRVEVLQDVPPLLVEDNHHPALGITVPNTKPSKIPFFVPHATTRYFIGLEAPSSGSRPILSLLIPELNRFMDAAVSLGGGAAIARTGLSPVRVGNTMPVTEEARIKAKAKY